jgi:hypothetical protein
MIAAPGRSPAPIAFTRVPSPPGHADDALQMIAPRPVAWLGLSLGKTTRAAAPAGQGLSVAGADHGVLFACEGTAAAARATGTTAAACAT